MLVAKDVTLKAMQVPVDTTLLHSQTAKYTTKLCIQFAQS
jgi:hypothetical protein